MNPEQQSSVLYIHLLVFASGFLLIYGIASVFRRKQEEERSHALPPLYRFFLSEIEMLALSFGQTLASMMPGQAAAYRNYLLISSLKLEIPEIFGAQTLCCALAGAGAAILTSMLYPEAWAIALAGVVFALLGWTYPATLVQSIAVKRQEAISKALPYAIDLVSAAMQAGLDFGAAIRYYVNSGVHGPLAQELGIMLHETELGKARVQALRDMAAKLQLDELRSLVSAVAQSSEMGSSLTDVLRVQAQEMRNYRFNKAERQAARAPSLMLLPTALFILPAVFIVIIVPIFLKMNSSGLGAIMGGH